MAENFHISGQRELLHTCRKTLSFEIERAARHGGLALAPPVVRHTIDEMQTTIEQIKTDLRAAGVQVDDERFDDPKQLAAIVSELHQPPPDPNRAMMIDIVRKTWINSRLEQALSEHVRLTLNLAEHPDALELPLNAQYQEFAGSPRPLPPDTQPIKVFDEAIGTLLILGAPGAGKTTMLMELARDLLKRAEANRNQPIPVIFNLSSWAQRRPPLDKWLVKELHRQYKVHPRIGGQWVREDALTLLLDGLDEVREDCRAACAEAINRFRQDHGLVRMVVCSRLADYEVLQVRLNLYGAVLIQPLTHEQVQDYLKQKGERLAALHQRLHNDSVLQELTTTPLMLYVLSIAYADVSPEELDGPTNQDEWRKRVFDRYVERMFDRGAKPTRYTREQAVAWLSWLAYQMRQRGLSVFYLEDLQPDWLPERLRWWYGLVLPVVVGLIVGLCIGLVAGPNPAVLWGIGAMLGVQLGLDINHRGTYSWPWHRLLGWSWRISLSISMSFGIMILFQSNDLLLSMQTVLFSIAVFIFPAVFTNMFLLKLHRLFNRLFNRNLILLNVELFLGFSVAISTSMVLIIVLIIISAMSNNTIIGTMEFIESEGGVPFLFIVSVITGLGISSGLTVNIFARVQLNEKMRWSWLNALLGLLLGFLIGSFYDKSSIMRYALTFMVIVAVSGYSQEMENHMKPNEGFWKSLHNAVWSVAAGSIIALLLMIGFSAGLVKQGDILNSVIIVVLLVGVRGGLAGCLQHLLIRRMLSSVKLFPHAAVPFLEEAVTRILMRRVGGAYVFLHRSLLDYFYAETRRIQAI